MTVIPVTHSLTHQAATGEAQAACRYVQILNLRSDSNSECS